MLTPAADAYKLSPPPSNADALRTFTNRNLIQLTGLLTVLLLSAACGKDDAASATTAGGAPPPASTAPRDPCELLTADDARAALGREATRTDPANMTGASMCQYMADNSENVSLQFRAAAASDFDDYVKQSVEMLGATAEPVAGIGDRAVLLGDQFVFMSRGQMYVLALGSFMPAQEKSERLRRLASAVLGRL